MSERTLNSTIFIQLLRWLLLCPPSPHSFFGGSGSGGFPTTEHGQVLTFDDLEDRGASTTTAGGVADEPANTDAPADDRASFIAGHLIPQLQIRLLRHLRRGPKEISAVR